MLINIGSINLDHVYRVPHLAKPGETVSSLEYRVLGGGKGANQSLAIAKAGGKVLHLGKLGPDGRWLRDELESAGVNVSSVELVAEPSGHAVIQVDPEGANSIVIHGGSNQTLSLALIAKVLGEQAPATVLLQNETNDVGRSIELAHRAGHKVAFNPAPMTDHVREYPLWLVDILVVNEVEAEALGGNSEAPESLRALCPNAAIVLTQGARGVVALVAGQTLRVPAFRVEAVDTVAAGDCFVGYLLASLDAGSSWPKSLERACAAAAISVSRNGAMASIPTSDEVDALLARSEH